LLQGATCLRVRFIPCGSIDLVPEYVHQWANIFLGVAIIKNQKRQRMIKRFFNSTPRELILGHDIPSPRLTSMGWLLILLYLGVPAMVIGGALDFILQAISGQCVGVWCLFLK
jgi:hypothetical protein